jgi:hypothetical protein
LIVGYHRASKDFKGAWVMSLAELMPLVEELSQPDKERLFEYLGEYVALDDPDEGLVIRPEVEQQLLRSRQRRESGVPGVSLEEVARQLGVALQ